MRGSSIGRPRSVNSLVRRDWAREVRRLPLTAGQAKEVTEFDGAILGSGK